MIMTYVSPTNTLCNVYPITDRLAADFADTSLEVQDILWLKLLIYDIIKTFPVFK